MTQEEKLALLQAMFQGADLRGAQIIAVNEGEVCFQKYGNAPSATKTEEEIKAAVVRLMEETDETGDYLMRDKEQFYAVKAVLTQLCGFPVKPAEFGRALHNLELDDLRIKYDYENIRKVHPHQLPANVSMWHHYQNTADDYSMKQVKVAVRLIEMLEMDAC